jgi:hypothetical protein
MGEAAAEGRELSADSGGTGSDGGGGGTTGSGGDGREGGSAGLDVAVAWAAGNSLNSAGVVLSSVPTEGAGAAPPHNPFVQSLVTDHESHKKLRELVRHNNKHRKDMTRTWHGIMAVLVFVTGGGWTLPLRVGGLGAAPNCQTVHSVL